MFAALPWQNRISPRRSCAGVEIHHPQSGMSSSVVNASSRNVEPAADGMWAIFRDGKRSEPRTEAAGRMVGRVLGRWRCLG